MYLLGIKDIAELCNVSSSTVSNWRTRYSNFPLPVLNIRAGPIFDFYEIKEWLKEKNKTFEESFIFQKEKLTMRQKKISIIGRSKAGKSRLISQFLKFKKLYIEYFTKAGKDLTEINCHINAFKFLENRPSILRFIAPGSSLNGMEVPFTPNHVEQIKAFFKRIEEDKLLRPLNPLTDTFEIQTEASSLARNIMGDDFDYLTLEDTPGFSGDMISNIPSDSDLYILLLRDDNIKEFIDTFKKILYKIASSNLLFIYRHTSTATNENEYKMLEDETKEAMLQFKNVLSQTIENSIINSSLDALNPEQSFITMGGFNINPDTVSYPEEYFLDIFTKKLKLLFTSSKGAYEEDLIKEYQNELSDSTTLLKYVKELLGFFKFPQIGTSHKAYFKQENHNRVKSKDNYDIVVSVEANQDTILSNLFDLYNDMTYNPKLNIPKIIQEAIIKLIYIRLTQSIKYDCGLFIGRHPFEDFSCKTMFAEEAIFATDLLYTGGNDMLTIDKYITTLKTNGITSSTWNWVSKAEYSEDNFYCYKKLDIIKYCNLENFKSTTTQELIYNTYTLGLLKLGEYRLFDFLLQNISSEKLNPFMFL